MIRRFDGQMNDKQSEFDQRLRLLQKKFDEEISAHRATKETLSDTKMNMQIEIDRLRDESLKGKHEVEKLLNKQKEME